MLVSVLLNTWMLDVPCWILDIHKISSLIRRPHTDSGTLLDIIINSSLRSERILKESNKIVSFLRFIGCLVGNYLIVKLLHLVCSLNNLRLVKRQ